MKKLLILTSTIYILSFTPVQSQVIYIPADYLTIQQGIEAAFDGDTVLVDTGTYVERINFLGKNITVASKYLTTLDTNYISQTIIDGDSLGSVVTMVNGEDTTALLCGFTIQNGANDKGGGIRIIDASPIVTHCNIRNNKSEYCGSGIYAKNSNGRIINSTIKNNKGLPGSEGGGICLMGNTLLRNLIIEGNSAALGGGISVGSQQAELSNLLIKNNTGGVGAGLLSAGIITITNSVFEKNQSGGLGSALWCYFGQTKLINCTVVNNTGGAGAIYCRPEVNIYLTNTILFNNNPFSIFIEYPEPPDIYGKVHLNFCDIQPNGVGGSTGGAQFLEGNITEEPLFEYQFGSDYYLSNESPCVNAGTPDTSGLNIPESDFAGNSRMIGNRIDIGAMENQKVWGMINIPNDFATIQEGIEAAFDGDTVLVDTGTYVERINFLGKNITVGSKYLTTLDTNYIAQTIIDGDSLGSVVTLVNGEDTTALLCGFTIQNGANEKGGGLNITGSDPTIEHTIIKDNFASKYGGGIYITNSDATVSKSTIKGNTIYPQTDYSAGGGVYCYNSDPSINYSTIENNTILAADHNCSSSGGGIIIYSCGGSLKNTRILNNSVYSTTNSCWGGGLSFGLSTTTLSDLHVEGNHSDKDGGGLLFSSGSSLINNLKVINNSALFGGGIFISSDIEDSIIFKNIFVKSNSASIGGGILSFKGSFVNSIIESNTGSLGSAIFCGDDLRLINCTFINNTGGKGGVYLMAPLSGHNNVSLKNCILWGNTPYDLYIQYPEPPNTYGRAYLSYCNIKPEGIGGATGGAQFIVGNIDDEPQFENQFGYNYYPSNESPCINAGTPDITGLGIPELDIAGNPRIIGNRIDMGAMENQKVRGMINIPNDFATIQEGIEAAFDGDTVLVDTGTYVERINFLGKNITVGSKYLTTLDTNYIAQTIIDGDSLGCVVTFTSGEDSTALLFGFTVENGKNEKGGGLFIDGADPRVEHCVIKNNVATEGGGGIYLVNSEASISHTSVISNRIHSLTEHSRGGGIYCYNSNPFIDGVTIAHNVIQTFDSDCSSSGGGIMVRNCGGSFTNSRILNNSTYRTNRRASGGGLASSGSATPTYSDLYFEGNYSDSQGGGISSGGGTFTNIHLVNNSATEGGGLYNEAGFANIYNAIIAGNNGDGIYTLGGRIQVNNSTIVDNERFGLFVALTDAEVYNSVFWNNTDDEISGGSEKEISARVYLFNNNIEPNGVVDNENWLLVFWQGGNIEQEPRFETRFGYDYYPSDQSPCVNAGIADTSGLGIPETDIAGNSRVYGNRIDMGAMENQEVWLGTTNLLKPAFYVNLHPNPVSNKLFIEYYGEEGNIAVHLENIHHQLSIEIFKGYNQSGKQYLTYDCSPLPAGVYLIRIQNGNKTTVKKFVKL